MSSARDIRYGRRGGGWLPASKPVEQAQVTRVLCVGGPLDGVEVAMHHWGRLSAPPGLMHCDAGTYVLDRGRYHWHPNLDRES